MENTENMPRPEIILVADTVAREKNIDREDVFTAMEVAIQKAGRSKYGLNTTSAPRLTAKPGLFLFPAIAKSLLTTPLKMK